MSGACGTYGGNVRVGILWENLRGRVYLEDIGKHGRVILKWILKKWDGGIDWIDPAQDRDRWRAVVKVVAKLRVP